MNILKYHFYYLESHFVGFPMVIKVTIFLTLLLGTIYFLSLLRFFLLAKTHTKEEKRMNRISKMYEQKLKTILFSEQNLSADQISKELKIKHNHLKDWEKIHISQLILKLIKTKNRDCVLK